MSSIEVRDMRVLLGGQVIVAGADFDVPIGKVTALVGPNGAGKSTLLRGMAGVLRADSGAVRIDDVDLLALGRRERARRLALVEQDSTSEFSLTVRQAVDLGRTPHRSLWGGSEAGDEAAVAAALERTGAQEWAARQLGTLSGGERQRVHLARALAQEPEVLMLDEPTNHLDVRAQLQTMRLLQELAEHGMTVVAALHDLNLAAQYCDHVVVLAAGEVAAAGPVAQVLTSELIETTYGVVADVFEHPRNRRPLVAFS